ncbi:MAG: D-lactate dehydrogenase, partial [Pseudomonadota bacterium]
LLRETAGCAGKLAVFAVRVDTFPADVDPKLFYIGSETTETLTTLRRRLLKELPQLPILGEYIHRDCFEIAERYGKDTFQMIKWLGTDRLPLFFTIKGRIDAICRRLPLVPNALTDLVMQGFSRLTPRHLPRRLTAYRDRFEHHLIVQAPRDVAKQTAQILSEVIGDAKGADFFECDAADGAKALLHRFAAAGAAMRFGAVRSREVEGVISLDIALRRNDRDWFETLPSEIEDKLVAKIYYGHLFCHVFHQDYVVKKGVDTAALKRDLLALLEQRGAEYPAEHNVGHIYEAKPALKAFYAELDPTNTFNPGIGKTARERAGLSGCDVGGAEPGSRVETYPPAAAE